MDRQTVAFPDARPSDLSEPISERSPDRSRQFAAFAVLAILLLGFGVPPLGAWTGPLVATWFIGTQGAWRGFLLLAAIAWFQSWLSPWPHGFLPVLAQVGWRLAASVLGIVPYLLHRLTTERRQGVWGAFALPCWAVVWQAWVQPSLPAPIRSILQEQSVVTLLPRLAALVGPSTLVILVFGCASFLVWMWGHRFRPRKTALGIGALGAVAALFLVHGHRLYGLHATAVLPRAQDPVPGWTCLACGLSLGIWSLRQSRSGDDLWTRQPEAVALLRSPRTGEPLQVALREDRGVLETPSGERFPIRKGIPSFVEKRDITGSNDKYHLLYEIIGGFYDDAQVIACALRGVDREQYFMSYLRYLEVRPGDSVLETSVGTGLNFGYLPRGTRLFGLDLSPEMLANARANFQRWNLDARLVHGNAEHLPFADDSFDVVFHVGGINFFSDRSKAILEMIRVAKPGSRLLIADETEAHVKAAYEHIPITRLFFRNRTTVVQPPIDLVPKDMLEIHLEPLANGRFYALTFRKPC